MNPINVSKLTNDELKTLIQHHEEQRKVSESNYLNAITELARREVPELDFAKSLAKILQASRNGMYTSYGQLAEESGAPWNRVRYKMNVHLWAIVTFAHDRRWPMLSAVVVNKQNVPSGNMEPDTLRGFINAETIGLLDH